MIRLKLLFIFCTGIISINNIILFTIKSVKKILNKILVTYLLHFIKGNFITLNYKLYRFSNSLLVKN